MSLEPPPRLLVPLIVTVCMLSYAGLHVWAEQSEGFAFIDHTLRESPVIQRRVGAVQKVTLDPLRGFRENAVDSNEWVTMTLRVVGKTGSLRAEVKAQKANGVWSITGASIDGHPVELFAAIIAEPLQSAAPLGFDVHALTEVRTLKALPDEVRASLALHGGISIGIADRNERFNRTDMVFNRAVPMRRFMVGGVSDSNALVSYEQGGRGYFMEAKVFSRSASGWSETQQWYLREKPETLHELVELIRSASR